MYTPHSVTMYDTGSGGERRITFLEGVFLETGRGGKIAGNKLTPDDSAALYVPFACEAVDAVTGEAREFCPPKAAEGFFIKGRTVEPEAAFAELKDRYEDVYRVSAVEVRDYGSPEMRHWQIGGK